MKKTYILIALATILAACSVFAVMRDNAAGNAALNSKKCSVEQDGLQLCADNLKMKVKSGEPVRIKLLWTNTSEIERQITRASTYKVTVVDEEKQTLIPVLERKMKEGTMTDEDRQRFVVLGRGKGNPIFLEPGESSSYEILLTERYDYDLKAKGKYYVTISKTISGAENSKSLEFVVDGIEIEVE
jgi:hypothetical protein